MKRTEANAIVLELLKKYEDNLDQTAPRGSTYQDCYNIETGKPCPEYIDLYGEVKEELRAIGIPYNG